MSIMHLLVRRALLPALLLGLLPAPVLAEPPHERGRGHEEKGERGRGGDERRDDERRSARRDDHPQQRHAGRPDWKKDKGSYRFDEYHRDVVIRFDLEHRYRCPLGLVESRYGCVPKGHSKKRYTVGRPLPPGVYVEILPRDLLLRLPPPPVGYVYRRVDGDVLLIAEAGMHVIDALVLFSMVR